MKDLLLDLVRLVKDIHTRSYFKGDEITRGTRVKNGFFTVNKALFNCENDYNLFKSIFWLV